MTQIDETFYKRVATIDELLSDAFIPTAGLKEDVDLATRRLAAWCKSSASGDWDVFAKRLARDGWSLDSIIKRLATSHRNPAAPLPNWMDDVSHVVSCLRADGSQLPNELSGSEPQPFQEIFAPLLTWACAERDRKSGRAALDLFAPDALADSSSLLLSRLTELCSPLFYDYFSDFRHKAMAVDADAASAPAGRLIYNGFIAEFRGRLLDAIIDNYPVLIRLIASITTQWINGISVFFQRTHHDVMEVRRRLNDAEPTTVRHVRGDLSDPHNDGQSVLVVEWSDGRKVVYKPKSLRVEKEWERLVTRLNESSPLNLRAMRVVCMDHYGWCEFIENEPCHSQEEVHLFYRRAGSMLSLLHLFCATDMHDENMIASRAQPVAIDLEMLLQPSATRVEGIPPVYLATELARERIRNSVFAVGLLPGVIQSADTRAINIGGLNRRANRSVFIRFSNINSDTMEPHEDVRDTATTNLPALSGEITAFKDYVDDVIEGFETFAVYLSKPTTRLILLDALERFSGMPVRVILRPTQFYFMLQNRMMNHEVMEDGAIWSAQADFVSRFSNWAGANDNKWPLLRAERDAITALNIPFFLYSAADRNIYSFSDASSPLEATPGAEAARDRIARFDLDAARTQIETIRLSAMAHVYGSPHASGPKPGTPAFYAPSMTVDALRALSDGITHEIMNMAIETPESASWIGFESVGDAEAVRLIPLGYDLYGGTAGIGVYLAAHAKVFADPKTRAVATKIFAEIKFRLAQPDAAAYVRAKGIGAGVGIGSLIYALTTASTFLDDPSLMDAARRGAELINPDSVAADRELDVMAGSAGAILALLRLHTATQDPAILDRASLCARHLQQKLEQQTDGRKLWRRRHRYPLTGMSHGASGYAYALGRLSSASGDPDLEYIVEDCLGYESGTFSEEHGNWPDLRGGTPEPARYSSCQWCHGAGGIGLSRVGLAKDRASRTKGITPAIDAAVSHVRATWPLRIDTLCCGNVGNVEFMREAGKLLNRPDLTDAASGMFSHLVERANAHKTFGWAGGTTAYNPTLFRGLAGVGYSALRWVDDRLPNILLWE